MRLDVHFWAGVEHAAQEKSTFRLFLLFLSSMSTDQLYGKRSLRGVTGCLKAFHARL